MTKSEQEMVDVINEFLKAGFIEDGATKEEIVRIPTTKSPLFGGTGGELTKLGGRLRFTKPETNIKATIGKRTTFIYRTGTEGANGITSIASLDTKEFSDIQKVLITL